MDTPPRPSAVQKRRHHTVGGGGGINRLILTEGISDRLFSGSLLCLWTACHCERRLKRKDIVKADIIASSRLILSLLQNGKSKERDTMPQQMPLKVTGGLLVGITRMYAKQLQALIRECNRLFSRMQHSNIEKNNITVDHQHQQTYKSRSNDTTGNSGRLLVDSELLQDYNGFSDSNDYDIPLTPPLRLPVDSPINVKRRRGRFLEVSECLQNTTTGIGILPDTTTGIGILPDTTTGIGILPDTNTSTVVLPDMNTGTGRLPDMNTGTGRLPDMNTGIVQDLCYDMDFDFPPPSNMSSDMNNGASGDATPDIYCGASAYPEMDSIDRIHLTPPGDVMPEKIRGCHEFYHLDSLQREFDLTAGADARRKKMREIGNSSSDRYSDADMSFNITGCNDTVGDTDDDINIDCMMDPINYSNRQSIENGCYWINGMAPDTNMINGMAPDTNMIDGMAPDTNTIDGMAPDTNMIASIDNDNIELLETTDASLQADFVNLESIDTTGRIIDMNSVPQLIEYKADVFDTTVSQNNTNDSVCISASKKVESVKRLRQRMATKKLKMSIDDQTIQTRSQSIQHQIIEIGDMMLSPHTFNLWWSNPSAAGVDYIPQHFTHISSLQGRVLSLITARNESAAKVNQNISDGLRDTAETRHTAGTIGSIFMSSYMKYPVSPLHKCRDVNQLKPFNETAAPDEIDNQLLSQTSTIVQEEPSTTTCLHNGTGDSCTGDSDTGNNNTCDNADANTNEPCSDSLASTIVQCDRYDTGETCPLTQVDSTLVDDFYDTVDYKDNIASENELCEEEASDNVAFNTDDINWIMGCDISQALSQMSTPITAVDSPIYSICNTPTNTYTASSSQYSECLSIETTTETQQSVEAPSPVYQYDTNHKNRKLQPRTRRFLSCLCGKASKSKTRRKFNFFRLLEDAPVEAVGVAFFDLLVLQQGGFISIQQNDVAQQCLSILQSPTDGTGMIPAASCQRNSTILTNSHFGDIIVSVVEEEVYC